MPKTLKYGIIILMIGLFLFLGAYICREQLGNFIRRVYTKNSENIGTSTSDFSNDFGIVTESDAE
ncbi:hypothetical protein LJC58_05930 [Lachnospiraceae bacterium OttesenSCG-928-D06]|nr:hypothetical protein [Lachnospiraceae bacterium OttesenSCG-928-D06]